MTSQGLDAHNSETIVAKANLALNVMRNTHPDIPKGNKFMSAKTLSKGDILFDMVSAEATVWLRREGICLEFMQGFGAMSEIKDHEHSCVVKNVLVGFHLSIESSHGVESTNDIPPNSILLAHWIKPIEWRFDSQCTAFMIVTFRTAEATNLAIRNNLYICGKRCTTRKLLPEPRCCYKCQAVGTHHIAAMCKEITDICDTCGGAHLSKMCTLKEADPEQHFCVNCKTHGHTSHDRLCPTYLHHTNELYARMPENLYKFFPTDNPNTWELAFPSQDAHQQDLPDNTEPSEWMQVSHKHHKKYTFPRLNTTIRPRTATSSNTIPLGQHQDKAPAPSQAKTPTQSFLDDHGMVKPARPGPLQQYCTPSQRQHADSYRSANAAAPRSQFSLLSTARPPPTMPKPDSTPV
jgi:hypothetical protein